MKSILLSIRPEWVEKILNGEKTIEIRKMFPKDYVGWVYIYCTKNGSTIKDGLVYDDKGKGLVNQNFFPYAKDCPEHNRLLNGKVVARFWCDKVEEHRPFFHWCIEKETCLTRDDVLDYLDSKDKFVGNPKRQDKVYAICISKLKVFDKPRELSEFKKYGMIKYLFDHCVDDYVDDNWNELLYLQKAPQNYCYIESEK